MCIQIQPTLNFTFKYEDLLLRSLTKVTTITL